MSKSGELLLKGPDVTGLSIGVAHFLQLGGCLVVGGSNFLVHERVELRPYGVCPLRDRGQMLLAPLCLALALCRRRFSLLLLTYVLSLNGFGGKISALHPRADRDLHPWIR